MSVFTIRPASTPRRCHHHPSPVAKLASLDAKAAESRSISLPTPLHIPSRREEGEEGRGRSSGGEEVASTCK